MSELHALLVGIDGHDPDRGPEGGLIPDLTGAVNDALRMEGLLKAPPLELPAERIRTLLSPGLLPTIPEPAPEDRPTRAVLVHEIRALGERAERGDQVLIHFSGHGVRVPTRDPSRKGGGTFDESLVPCDAGAPDGGVLRDVELYHLLSELAGAGLFVTLILDCCHSGGAMRTGGAGRVRGLGTRTGDWGPAASPVAEWDALYGRLDRAEPIRPAGPAAGAWRKVHAGSGWFPQPEGCVLLAACRATERAREAVFEGFGSSGALTHHLIEAIGTLGPRPTYRELERRLLARIHTRFETQRPVLEGDGDLRFLGRERWPATRGVTVLAVEDGGGSRAASRLRLAAGRAQGVRRGARFALIPPGATDGRPVEEARVFEADATTSWAERVVPPGGEARGAGIAPGWTAVLTDPGPEVLRRRVALEGPAASEEVADRLRRALRRADAAYVELVDRTGPDAPEVDFLVGVCGAGEDDGGRFVVLDLSGEPLGPPGERDEPIRVPFWDGDPDGADRLVRRLERMARFRNLRDLENPDPTSPLAHGLVLELVEGPRSTDWHRPDRRRPVPGGVVGVGETFGLVIRNESPSSLDVVVLDLQPDWGVSIAHPPPSRAAFETLEPGREIVAPLVASLPERFDEGLDVLKALGTVGPLDCSWLELPALGTTSFRGSGRPAAHSWTEARLEVTVVRRG